MRKRSSAKVWRERVAAWKASGSRADEFATGQPYAASTLRWWSYHLGKIDRAASSAKVAPRMVRVVRPAAAAVARGSTSRPLVVEVGGVRIAVDYGFDRTLLREVIAALGVT